MKKLQFRRACAAEFLGTYILVFFGVGSVHTAVLLQTQAGVWQVAVVWAVAISLAVYATGAISGAHINPAMTVAFAVFRGFSPRRVLPYILAQFLGAFCAAATLYGLFHRLILRFEAAHSIIRGQAGSELSGMVFGEYFPNPAVLGAAARGGSLVTFPQAFLGEAIGTAFLAFFVFAMTDRSNSGRPHSSFVAPFIGLTVAIIISIVSPLTQAGLNPARDFGPRLLAYFAGWGSIAIPGPRGGFFSVYILAPLVGGLIGAAIYEYVLSPGRRFRLAETPEIEFEPQ